jgi:ERCC4-type nuclease
MARDIVYFLNTIAVMIGGITGGRFVIIRTMGRLETVRTVTHLYNWWTNKSFDAHKGHMQDYDPVVHLCKPPIVYRVARALESIGGTKAKAITERFSTVMDMVMATERDWMSIPGIGKKLARDIVRSLHEKEG